MEHAATSAATNTDNSFRSPYQIPLETAIAWRRNWEADLAEAQPENYVRSFRLDVEELQDIIAVPGAVRVRIYFGWAARGSQDKMILVPVDANGVDMITGDGGVFDFSSPCPINCEAANTAWW